MAVGKHRGRLTFYLPLTVKQEIEEAAEAAGQSISTWIERACQAKLNQPTANSAGD
jgi:predicted HicB family RNase H-like nuclease